jgi:hypothetical protein
MHPPNLATSHSVSRDLDYVKRLESLLEEFCHGTIADKDIFARIKKKNNGLYFSERYTKDAYPRSSAARDVVDSDTIIEVARNSVDSDICRSLIDLDRCLFLRENGYDVLYREELFFAHRRP